MTSRDFCYWLQGFFEITESATKGHPEMLVLDSHQIKVIRNHLNMVFIHEIDPSMGGKQHQETLQAAHGGGGFTKAPKLDGTKTPKLDVSHILRGPDFSQLLNC